MKNLILFLFLVGVVIFQISVAGVFFPQRQIPDLALGFVVALVLALGFRESFGWILLTGLLIDANSGVVFGSTALAFFLVGWLISKMAGIADIRSRKFFFLFVLAVVVLAGEIFKDLLIFSTLRMRSSLLEKTFHFTYIFWSFDYFLKIGYTVAASYTIYYILRRISRRFFITPIRLAKR